MNSQRFLPPLLLLALAVLGSLSPARAAVEGLPVATSFTSRDTGGSGVYWTTTQDDRGVLYFGSDQVITFDGDRWLVHPLLDHYAVRALAVGRDRRVWVGSTNDIGYFDQNAAGFQTFRSLLSFLPADQRAIGDVWQVFADGDGAAFVTADALLLWNGHELKRIALPGARRVPAFQIDHQLFVYHAASGGLLRVKNGTLHVVIPQSVLGQSAVITAQRRDGRWLLVTTLGVSKYEDGRLSDFCPAGSAFIAKNILTAATTLPDGDIVVGTLYGGLAIISADGRLKRVISTTEGLPSRSVYSVFVARDGALWVTSSSNITRIIPDDRGSLFDERNGLAGKNCRSVAGVDSSTFVATDEGLFKLAESEGTGRFVPIDPSSGYYNDLQSDGAGGLYAAGFKGVFHLRDGRTDAIYSTSKDIFLFRPSAVEPGTFIVGDATNIVRVRPDRGVSPGVVLARLPDIPATLVEDPTGRLWVGTISRGAFSVPPGARDIAAEPVTDAQGQPHTGSALVARLGPDVIVFSRRGAERHLVRSGEVRPIANFPHSPSSAVSNLDREGGLWVAIESSFNEGAKATTLGRLTLSSDGQARWQPFLAPGMEQIGNCTCLVVDRAGILWAGGSDRLLRLVPDELRPVTPPVAPLLSASVEDGARLPARQNTVAFDFAALDYSRRAALRFQTRLNRSDWSAPLNSSHLTLAGLSDGRYAFSVRSIDSAGFTGPETTWAFTILPPWYRTPYAWGAWLALAAAAIYGGIQWRLYYLRQHNLRLEALVQKKTAQLEKANAAKSEFIANMSHEIRNPISGILGLSLALEETQLDPRQKGVTDSIRSCATLLATLVDDVLDFAKIEAGKVELRPAPFALRAMIDECLAMVQDGARRAGSSIHVTVDAALPARVIGDSPRVQQILLNYLTNALKFGGGRPITVGAQRGRHERIHLFVRDEGIGMTGEEAGSLFTKFTRLEQARAGNIRGTGLGLAVCRLLAEKMSGTVGVESEPGRGSCFWVDLPLPPADAAVADTPALTAGSEGLRALIVEDIDYNAIAMQAVLRKLGITSDIASDGPTALERLRQTSYDVAFMDWNLPGLIGTEVVARYRAIEPPGHRTIIIATTAYSAEFNREACLQAGMDAFIAKPFTPEKIAAALRDLRGSLRGGPSVAMGKSETGEDAIVGLDLQMLRFLADESAGGLAEQIDRYLDAFESDRVRLAPAIESAPPREIHRVAHRLGSHASLINAAELKQLCVELQNRAAEDRAVLARLAAEFDRGFEDLKCRLEAFRASLGSA